jgi:hypothetical protein
MRKAILGLILTALALAVTACPFVDSFQNSTSEKIGVNVWKVTFTAGPTGLVASDETITAFRGLATECKRTSAYLPDFVIVCRAPGAVELTTSGVPLPRVIGTLFEQFRP